MKCYKPRHLYSWSNLYQFLVPTSSSSSITQSFFHTLPSSRTLTSPFHPCKASATFLGASHQISFGASLPKLLTQAWRSRLTHGTKRSSINLGLQGRAYIFYKNLGNEAMRNTIELVFEWTLQIQNKQYASILSTHTHWPTFNTLHE